MPKIRCDQCQTISATSKGYCPECGAIFVPPYAIVEDNGSIRYAQVREDIGQGKERKLLLKKDAPAEAAPEAAAARPAVAEERTLADLGTAPAVMLPPGEDAFPGFSLLLTMLNALGWLTVLGGPLGAAAAFRETSITLAVIWAMAGFFLGLFLLALAGGGRVLLAMESHTRAMRAAQATPAGE